MHFVFVIGAVPARLLHSQPVGARQAGRIAADATGRPLGARRKGNVNLNGL
jgi:hypothetical protein